MQITQNIYVVAPTMEKQKHVLEKLEELGYVWADGRKATNFIPLGHNDRMKVIFIPVNKKQLLSGTLNNERTRKYKKMPFASFFPKLLLS